MKIRALIFDCDGTLTDSLGNALVSFNAALARGGEAPVPPETIKRYFGVAADRILFQVLQDEARAAAAFEHYIAHQGELARNTVLHPGVSELLQQLVAHKVPLGIVTGRHERDLTVLLQPHGIRDFFAAVICDNHLQRSKPAPDGILLACQQLGVMPSETLYIGDSATDLQAARAAGSWPVAALWDSWAKREELAKEKPVLLAEHPAEIWEFYQTFGSS